MISHTKTKVVGTLTLSPLGETVAFIRKKTADDGVGVVFLALLSKASSIAEDPARVLYRKASFTSFFPREILLVGVFAPDFENPSPSNTT